jgi:hypothetical protein
MKADCCEIKIGHSRRDADEKVPNIQEAMPSIYRVASRCRQQYTTGAPDRQNSVGKDNK